MEIANKAADGSLVLRFAKHFKLYDHLPNVSEKDVKGLLFRKQPLHTSPTTGAKAVELSPAFLRAMMASPHLHPKGEAGDSRLSSLGNLTSPPRRLERV